MKDEIEIFRRLQHLKKFNRFMRNLWMAAMLLPLALVIIVLLGPDKPVSKEVFVFVTFMQVLPILAVAIISQLNLKHIKEVLD